MPFSRSHFTGFPFDDTDYDTNDHLQSTLNDLAQRHPEFATHLNFPTWRRKRHGSGSSADKEDSVPQTSGQNSRSFDTPDSRRFADHSFPSGFNRFPFTQHFDDFTDDLRTEEKPPEIPRPHEKRGRKVNPNLPQHLSNTVDLGQKQVPVEETRGQRSMSAPPENRTANSNTSKTDNDPSREMGNMFQRPGRVPQPRNTNAEQPTTRPKERVIPIFVEGRDEPVIPKNVNIEPEKVFNDDPNHIYQQNFYQQPMSTPKQQTSAPSPQQNASTFTRPTTPPGQRKPTTKQAANTQEEQQDVQQEQHPSVNINDPLEKIKLVKSDVLNLMQQVEDFTGTRKDKHYIYLDEMLTRNLLKLDNVETEGKDNIRTARREAIKCIQECINKLDANAQAFEKRNSNVTETVSLPVKSNSKLEEAAQQPSKEPKKPIYKSEAKIVIKTPEIISDQGAALVDQEKAAPMEVTGEISTDLIENADKPTTLLQTSTESMDVDSRNEGPKDLKPDSNLVTEEKTIDESIDGNTSETKATDILPPSVITNSSQLADETNM